MPKTYQYSVFGIDYQTILSSLELYSVWLTDTRWTDRRTERRTDILSIVTIVHTKLFQLRNVPTCGIHVDIPYCLRDLL